MRLSVVTSAVVAALVGFGSTVALIISAAQAVGATPGQTSSWVAALCLCMAGTSGFLSLRHRLPIITAWSTPGAALVAATSGVTIEAAVGAFLLAGALILATAAFRPVGALIERIPAPVAAAMLAGVIVRFVVAVFESAQGAPLLVLPLVALFLVVRVVSPALAVLAVLGAGLAAAFGTGTAKPIAMESVFANLEWVAPSFDPAVLVGLGLPLYLVTMASQNLPGFAVLRASGYAAVPTRSILAVTGFASVLSAPFGAHTSNLAAISAAICTGPDTHPDPGKRWMTGPFYAGCYLLFAIFGGALIALITALPAELIKTVAGLGLMGALAAALGTAMSDEGKRFPAILTLTVTASGFQLLGIGSAFWGLLAGLLAVGLDRVAGRAR
ncbi:MAG TPA: benzoate/H(+) symporter BenE family transporter [Microvirga sp.]|jgi:benzoate membrane transport protein|nr:benzoate/H(+) symporter BenE family transporter [Microvirga sp.]